MQFSSQGSLLAIFLAKYFKTPVDLVSCNKQLKGVSHLIADETEADRLGFIKDTLEK